MWIYILIIVFIPICYFVWTIIHELSHIYMAHKTIGINHWELDLIPKIDIKNFQFIFAYCFYTSKRQGTWKEKTFIYIAPRFPDFLGILALPFTCYIPEPYFWFAIIFCGGAIVDLFVGSLGISKKSDLRKAANEMRISPWWWRIFGFCIIICSLMKTIHNLSEVKGWF